MAFISALLGGFSVAVVAYFLLSKMFRDECGEAGDVFDVVDKYKDMQEAFKRKNDELAVYKENYEHLCRSFTELLDKYEELYNKEGE